MRSVLDTPLDAPPLEVADVPDVVRVEAILFAARGETMALAELARQSGVVEVLPALQRLAVDYEGRGVMLVVGEDGVAIRTRPECSDLARRLAGVPRRHSRAVMETLAVIAMHGPMTRSEIERHRGVGLSSGVMEQAVDAGWVVPGPRRETPGRPMTWSTTQAFLDAFALTRADVAELAGSRRGTRSVSD